jgi:hypothetical protein
MESSMNLNRSFRAHATVFSGALALVSALAASSASAAGTINGFPSLYESVRSKVCTAKTSCLVNFDAVPANTLLQATNLSCLVNTVGANPEDLVLIRIVERTAAGANPVEKTAFPVQNANAGSSNTTVFGLNEPIRLAFKAGDVATLAVGFDKTFDIGILCTLSGDLLKKEKEAV